MACERCRNCLWFHEVLNNKNLGQCAWVGDVATTKVLEKRSNNSKKCYSKLMDLRKKDIN